MNKMYKPRGQPAKTEIERLQSKLWFSTVSLQSGMNASQLERFFLKQIDPENGSTKELSHCWRKYARGERLPRVSWNEAPSAVSLAEQAFPWTACWITSPLWTVLKKPDLSTSQLAGLIAKTHPDISKLFAYNESSLKPVKVLTITLGNWNCLIQIASFEAFGAMVAYCRSRIGYGDGVNSILTKDCRQWLHKAHCQFPAIRKHRDELVGVLHKFLPELGDLSYLGKEPPDYDPFAEILMRQFGNFA